jgi:hypothetical protein
VTLTGPQKYPGANLTRWYGTKYPGDAMESNTGVVHTTEGTSLPDYSGGAVAPNFTLVPDFPAKKLKVYQHFDFDRSSRALVNAAGGVQTNTLNAVQFELVGTCSPDTHKNWNDKKIQHIFWPEAPDWALLEFAKVVRWAYDHHNVPMTSTVTWKAYPGSYGSNGVRLSGKQWTNYSGWLGHQHVPENVHGDPGSFQMGKVLVYAKNKTWENTLSMTPAQVHAAVWDVDDVAAPKAAADIKTNSTWQPRSFLTDLDNRVRAMEVQLAAIAAKLGAA